MSTMSDKSPSWGGINGTSSEAAPLLVNTDTEPKKPVVPRQPLFLGYANMTTGFIGGGLLALPYGVMEAGLWLGLAGLVFFALVAVYTCNLLLMIKRRLPEDQQHVVYLYEIGDLAFGRWGSRIANAASIITQVGFCCAYVIFICSNLNSLYSGISEYLWALIILPVFILFSWLRSLRLLAPTSLIAVFTVLGASAAVIAFGFEHAGVLPLNEYPAVNPKTSELPVFWGIAAFAYCVHNLVLPLHSISANPVRFNRVVNLSTFSVMVLYCIFGSLGYMFYRDATDSVITTNLPQGNVVVIVVKILLCLVLTFTFPVQLFPVTQTIEAAWLDKSKPHYWIKQNVVRACTVLFAICIAMAIPLFGLFSSLVGAFSVSAVMFILPPLFYVKLNYRKLPKWEVVFNVAVIVLGAIGSVIAFVVDIIAIVEALKTAHAY